jgi:hypothetical protein
MNRRIVAACFSLGLLVTSLPSHAFLDDLFGKNKSADGQKTGESQQQDGSDGPQPANSASAEANKAADKALYKPITYINGSVPGPVLIVLPGDVKSSNANFTQKFGSNNIADYAELELSRANFRVLERSGLGSLIKEVELAYGLGDPAEAAKMFKRGKFKTTKWIVKFDVLKAESVAQAKKGFDGAAVGQVAGASGALMFLGPVGLVAAGVASSVKTADAADIWIIGLRYKILDANTTEQVATGYVEDKMELGASSASVMGVSQGASGGLTLDSMVQRLVQSCVAEMDGRYKLAANAATKAIVESGVEKNARRKKAK